MWNKQSKQSCRINSNPRLWTWAFYFTIAITVSGNCLIPSQAKALNLSAVYHAACEKQIGVIVNVDDAKISLINLQGELKQIPRFDVIYLAQYPTGRPPIPGFQPSNKSEVIKVRTLFNDELVDLVEGWLIDHSEKQLSFLTTAGVETVIDIEDIWDIRYEGLDNAVSFPSAPEFEYNFEPPYPFLTCPQSIQNNGPQTQRKIYPQYILGDPLLIKKELDRLQEGHQLVETFIENKPFYAVPQVYRNSTDLGIWANVGSRHGASGNRTNNLLPFVRSELSDGPFRFQRLWVTGSAPMPYSIQEEPQTQFYYRLKSDYLHFSVMYDVARMLIGEENYRWQIEDLKNADDRINEIFHIGGGFDRNGFSLGYTITRAQYGVRNQDLFFFSRANLNKLSFTHRLRNFRWSLFHAFGSDRKPEINEVAEGNTEEDIAEAEAFLADIPDYLGDFRIYRFNADWLRSNSYDIHYSAIYRKLDFHRHPDKEGLGEFTYRSVAVTNAIYLNYAIGMDLTISTYLAWEILDQRFGLQVLSDKGDDSYGKAGISIMLRI